MSEEKSRQDLEQPIVDAWFTLEHALKACVMTEAKLRERGILSVEISHALADVASDLMAEALLKAFRAGVAHGESKSS